MSELPIQQGGLRVLSGIVPASSASTYGTHYSYLGVGGYVEVPNIDYRNSIPPDSNMNDEGYSTGRRRYGMMVYVIDEDKLYRLFPFSGGSVVSMETFTGTSELNQVTMLSNNNGWIEVPDLSVLITGGTYFSGNSSIVLYDSTGGTVSITGITTTDVVNPGNGRVLVSTGNSENIFVAQSNMVFNGTNLNITGGTFITDSSGSLHSSAIIQFKSTTKGVLLPGMTTSQKNAIVNPTTGLTVYDSTIEDISVYTSSGWTGVIAERDNLQKVTERGNSTNSGLIISGTTYLVGSGSTTGNTFVTSNSANTQTFTIKDNGNILIGTTTDAGYKLDVVGADSRFNGVRVGLGAGGVSSNTVVGTNALANNTTGLSNTAVGNGSLRYNIDGTYNTAYGVDSLNANTTGGQNVAMGWRALSSSTTAYLNVAIGSQALFANITGQNNTALGSNALYNNTASNNTAVGYQAGYSNTSGGITALGYQAGYSNTSGSLIAIGYTAGNKNTTGTSNIFIGTESGYFNTTGSDNIGIGTYALNSGGSQNTGIGRQTLFNNTANGNIAIGYQAGFSGVPNTTGANNIFIGYQSTGVLATESNRTWIGNSSTTSTWLAGNVLVGTTTDAGYKLNVNGTVKISSTIYLGGNTDIIDPSSNSGFMTIGSNQPIRFTNASSTEFLRIATSGNVLIGRTTDFGYKLDVSGTTRVVSTGSTSGSTTLTLQNSTGRTTTEFRSDGVIGISSASTFTTQVTSVISASTTNSGIAIVPNGTGAFTLNIPDGTAVGGTARGTNAVDLQMSRTSASSVAAWNYDSILGGRSNYMSANADGYRVIGGGFNNQISVAGYSFIGGGSTNIISGGGSAYNSILGGLSNTASSSYSIVIGGSSNTASGQYSVAGGTNNIASGQGSITIGYGNNASGNYSLALGIYNSASAVGAVALGGSGSGGGAGTGGNTASGIGSFAVGQGSSSYLYGQNATAAYKFAANGDAQQSLLTSRAISAVTSGGTVTLSLDGTGITNLIIPNGNNRAWNVVVNTITVCTVVSGGTLTVGDAHAGEYKFLFKRVGGTSTISPITTSSEVADTSMATASYSFSAGTSQQMSIRFNAPNTANNSTFRAVAKVALTEVAW